MVQARSVAELAFGHSLPCLLVACGASPGLQRSWFPVFVVCPLHNFVNSQVVEFPALEPPLCLKIKRSSVDQEEKVISQSYRIAFSVHLIVQKYEKTTRQLYIKNTYLSKAGVNVGKALFQSTKILWVGRSGLYPMRKKITKNEHVRTKQF